MISTFMRLKQQTKCGVFAKLRIWCLHFSFFSFSFPGNIMPWWLLWNRTITGAPLKEGDLTCCMAMAAVAYSKWIGKDWNFPWRRGNLQNPQFPHLGSTWQINRFLSHSCPPFFALSLKLLWRKRCGLDLMVVVYPNLDSAADFSQLGSIWQNELLFQVEGSDWVPNSSQMISDWAQVSDWVPVSFWLSAPGRTSLQVPRADSRCGLWTEKTLGPFFRSGPRQQKCGWEVFKSLHFYSPGTPRRGSTMIWMMKLRLWNNNNNLNPPYRGITYHNDS